MHIERHHSPLQALERVCPVCSALPGDECVVAVEYTPIMLDVTNGQISGGARRPVGLYFPKLSPHVKRGAP